MGGGSIASDTKDIYPVKQEERQIEFSVAYGKRLIGYDVLAEEMLNIIEYSNW
jgi:hypothetical protein